MFAEYKNTANKKLSIQYISDNKKLSIQYISDIHLEFYDKNEEFNIIPHSVNLALCGDIGYPGTSKYINFIKKCSYLFKNVFVIFGNHEYYNSVVVPYFNIETIEKRKEYTKDFPGNVYFLDNSVLYLDIITNDVYKMKPINLNNKKLVKIIGSTLWSNINYHTGKRMNDSKAIYKNNWEQLSWVDINNLFHINVKWILNQIDKEPDIKCLLLTHHAPHPIFMNPQGIRMQLGSAYYTEIPELYEKQNLIACICGHTHNTIKTTLYFKNNNKIYFLSNQVGYKNEFKPTSFFGGFEFSKYNPNDKSKCLFELHID